ncbi:MAG: fatty acid desaturase [Roseovarius sp.]|nr:fatty acid desaturase [Roseovarius sp.]
MAGGAAAHAALVPALPQPGGDAVPGWHPHLFHRLSLAAQHPPGRRGRRDRPQLAVAAWVALVWLAFGVAGLVVLGLSAVLAGVIGVFLVYLQHNFEETYWDRKPDLDFRKATLVGSSSLDLGHWWDIGTGNIAYHDLHHFNPAIPSYRLRQCQKSLPDELKSHDVIRWPEAIASFRLKLWDEERQRLVPFPPRPGQAAIAAE